MVVRLTLSYRGAAYAGWQRQANALTVQEVVEGALARFLGAPVRIAAASRTDAGVHARGQTAHLEPAAAAAAALALPSRALVHGVNPLLPPDVRVMAAHRMPAGFHARRSAAGKEYSYLLSRAAVVSPLDAPLRTRVPADLDLAAMRQAATLLQGRHDFSAFALAGGSHTQPFRTIAAAGFTEEGADLRFSVIGDGFLRGMVRALVGTLLDVGLGRRTTADLAVLLGGAPRGAAGATAPAQGLVLERVFYPPQWQPVGGE
jgi:tRNA pseudouridine38-40 synthase